MSVQLRNKHVWLVWIFNLVPAKENQNKRKEPAQQDFLCFETNKQTKAGHCLIKRRQLKHKTGFCFFFSFFLFLLYKPICPIIKLLCFVLKMSKVREMLEKNYKNTINLFSILSLGTKYGSAVLEHFIALIMINR